MFSIIKFEKKEKEERKRVEFHFYAHGSIEYFDEQAMKKLRIVFHAKNTSIDFIYYLHARENYPRRPRQGKKEKAWENSGKLDK